MNTNYRPLPTRLHLCTLALLASASLLTLAACSAKADKAPAGKPVASRGITLTAAQRKHIHLYTVSPANFRRTIDTTGSVTFNSDRATAVLAPFSGPVSRLLVGVGDTVTAGQPLATVNSPDFAAAVSDYRKALATMHTAHRLAALDKDLLAHQGISAREAAQAETDAANAAADADAALHALLALGADAKTIKAIQAGKPVDTHGAVIRAPIAGTVVEKQISPGQRIEAGATPCFTVADLSQMWVMARLFAADVGAVAVGDPAEVVAEGKSFAGKVTNISAIVDTDTGAVSARVLVDNPGDLLKKNMYVRVRIHSRKTHQGLLVPVSAILRDDENLPFVYVARADGDFARRRVTLGYRDGNRFDISAGLKAGDKIVVDGGIFLRFIESQ